MKGEDENEEVPSIKYFLSQKQIRCNLLILIYIWVVVSFNFQLLIFQLKHMPGSEYKNVIGNSLADILALFAAGIVYN